MSFFKRGGAVFSRVLLLACVCVSANAEDLVEAAPVTLGFEDIFHAARSFSPQLQSAYQVLLAEREEKRIGLAGLLPQVSVNAAYQHEDSDNIYTDEDSLFFDPELDRSGGELIDHYWRATVVQPLFDVSAYQNYRKAMKYVTAAELRYQIAEIGVMHQVSDKYLAVLLASQRVYLNRQKLEALEEKLLKTERAFELEVGDKLSVLQVRSNRDLARSDWLRAQSDLVDAQTLLYNFTGRHIEIPEHVLRLSSQAKVNLALGERSKWLDGVSNNLAVKEASERVAEQQKGLLAAKGDHLPKINLRLSYLDRQSEDSYRTRTDAVAAVEVSMPLFTGGRLYAATKKARARLEATRAELSQIRLVSEQKVSVAYLRLQSASQRLDALEKVIESSEAFVNAAERRRTFNIADQVAVLEARTSLVDAKLQFVETLNETLMSDLELCLESGFLNVDRLKFYDQILFDTTETP